MAYCTYSDVQSEFKSITFSSSFAITDTKVTAFIAQIDAIINSKIGTRYSTPITGTEALLVVKAISIYLTASRVAKILELKTGQVDKNQLEIDKNAKDAKEMLKEIVEGKMILIDATLRSSANGVSDYNYSNDIEQILDVTSDQW